MMLDIFLWCSLVGLLIAIYIISQRKPKNFPPGPWGFPILGHLPLLGLEPHKTAMGWKAKYGPIVGLDFGSFPCIFISDPKLIKDAGTNTAFSGRPKLQYGLDRSGGQAEGIIFTEGRTWREQRTFTHRRLKELGGFGTRSMEAAILDQVEDLVERLREEAGHPISTHIRFHVAAFNALWTIIAGSPFKHDDPELRKVIKILTDSISSVNFMAALVMFIPFLGRILPDWITRKRDAERTYKPVIDFLQPYLDQPMATRVQGEPRDFIGAFLNEVKDTSDQASSFYSSRGKQSLATTVMDLFLAGVETTSTTLEWVCLLLAQFAEIQDRLALEISDVVGHLRPSLENRKRMPYTEAVLHEVMRFRTLVPMGLFHSTAEPVQFHGFDIPKDTMVFFNLYAAHMDPELWYNPEKFRPERWLNEDGIQFIRREGLLSFGTGKRACLGEQLARDELFLFTVGVIQTFRIELDRSTVPPNLEPKLGGSTMSPLPHNLVFALRKEY